MGVPWGAQGNFPRFVEKWTPNSEQMCLMYRAGAQNLASWNSPLDPADPHKVAYGPQLATPLPHAGGQDDVSSKETPSNQQFQCSEYKYLKCHVSGLKCYVSEEVWCGFPAAAHNPGFRAQDPAPSPQSRMPGQGTGPGPIILGFSGQATVLGS